MATATATQFDMTSAEAARLLGVTQKTVIRWATNGKIQYSTIKSLKGTRYKFSGAEINALADQNQTQVYSSTATDETNQESVETETTDEEKNTASEKSSEKNQGEGVLTQKFTGKMKSQEAGEVSVFKTLFEQKEEQLQEANQQLQKASYRIAQLEEQIKTRIPLLEHRTNMQMLEEKQTDLQGELGKMQKRLEREKIVNISFFVLSALILIEAIIFLLA